MAFWACWACWASFSCFFALSSSNCVSCDIFKLFNKLEFVIASFVPGIACAPPGGLCLD